MSYPFDKITHFIEEFANANSDEFQKIRLDVIDEVYTPFKQFKNTSLSNVQSESLISDCKKIGMDKISALAKTNANEMWYIIIRRFPNSVFSNPIWQYYSTLAALKWSNEVNVSNLGYYDEGAIGVKGVSFAITGNLIFDCFRLACYCDCLGDLTNRQRWIGKGLKLFVNSDLNLILSNDQEIIDSVNAYEARRPKNILFGETGNPYLFSLTTKFEIIFLVDTIEPTPIYLPKSNLTLNFNRLLGLVEVKNILAYLLPYREAILDLYKIEIEAIIQAYYALSQRIIGSIPFHQFDIINEKRVINSDLANPVDNHQLRFFFDTCHTAYLRFKLNTFKSELSQIAKHPLISSEKTEEELIEDFFNTFLLDDIKREKIEILEVNNPPVIFLNQDNICYWDLQYFYDFFRGLVENSKNWFASQHGDRFTLIIKSYLEKNIEGISTIFFNKEMKFENEKFEIDLLIEFKEKIFLIEAKAFAKNRDFWNGYRKAITARSTKINEAVKQVERTHKLLLKSLKAGKIDGLSNNSTIEWVLCLPEQEYLHPLNKYGMINETPRVCTLEELVKIITG